MTHYQNPKKTLVDFLLKKLLPLLLTFALGWLAHLFGVDLGESDNVPAESAPTAPAPDTDSPALDLGEAAAQ